MPADAVNPIGFGGVAEASTAAWYGDKILGAFVARELHARRVTEVKLLHDLYVAAVSNETMAAHLDTLLPASLLPPEKRRAVQEHDCGTLLEACVKEVDASDQDAIAELARFLIDRACEMQAVRNFKGRLIELGGSLTTEQISGPPMRNTTQKGRSRDDGVCPSNSPVFKTRATYSEFAAEGVAGSKKAAEQEASVKVLQEASAKVLRTADKRNSKKRLIELGGSSTVEWTSGPSSSLVFEARATYLGFAAEGVAGSKKAAEREASAKVLREASAKVLRAAGARPTMRCATCGRDQGKGCFSNNQRKKPAGERRCTACVAAAIAAEGSTGHVAVATPSTTRTTTTRTRLNGARDESSPAGPVQHADVGARRRNSRPCCESEKR